MKLLNIYIASGLISVGMLSSCTKDFLKKEMISASETATVE